MDGKVTGPDLSPNYFKHLATQSTVRKCNKTFSLSTPGMIALCRLCYKNPYVSSTLNSLTPLRCCRVLKEWVNDWRRVQAYTVEPVSFSSGDLIHLPASFQWIWGCCLPMDAKDTSLCREGTTCLLKPALCSSAQPHPGRTDMGTIVSTRVPSLKTHLLACQGVSCDTRAYNVQFPRESPASLRPPASSGWLYGSENFLADLTVRSQAAGMSQLQK